MNQSMNRSVNHLTKHSSSSSSSGSDSDDRGLKGKRPRFEDDLDVKAADPGYIETEDDPRQREPQSDDKKHKSEEITKLCKRGDVSMPIAKHYAILSYAIPYYIIRYYIIIYYTMDQACTCLVFESTMKAFVSSDWGSLCLGSSSVSM